MRSGRQAAPIRTAALNEPQSLSARLMATDFDLRNRGPAARYRFGAGFVEAHPSHPGNDGSRRTILGNVAPIRSLDLSCAGVSGTSTPAKKRGSTSRALSASSSSKRSSAIELQRRIAGQISIWRGKAVQILGLNWLPRRGQVGRASGRLRSMRKLSSPVQWVGVNR